MPVSSEGGKSYIRNLIGRIKHEKLLDIGCGCGTYAKMFPEANWTGIEVWRPYVAEYGLNDLYENLIIEDARLVDYSSLGRFDVAFLGDVLEHMEQEEARILVEKIRGISDTVVASIPIGHWPQGECEGNPYERHVKDDWSDAEVRQTFGEPSVGYIENHIGVYFWSNKNIRPKICVYTISKNEEQFIERWANSAKDADLLLIADTGSADRTIEIARQCGVKVHEICITPWRFDHARNASIALIPRDIDICICMDADEVLEPGWREEIERVWTPQTTRLSYLFDWGCNIKFRYEKIHARHGYYWHHPCHEYPVYDKRINEVYAHTDRLLVSHHPDPTKSRGQYLDLLELSVKEDPVCPRNAFYYARELSFARKWEEAIKECNRYLALPGATWENERCYAYRVIGICQEELGNFLGAEAAFQRAAAEAPNTREPWCQLAMLYYRNSKWAECYAASMRALSIKDKALVYTADPAVWGHWAHDLASISAWNLGLKETALDQARQAVELSPEDGRLLANLRFIEQETVKPSTPIPNIIHFMWFTGPKSREFSFINYLAVKVAKEVQKPEKIYFYYNEDLTNNPHWEAMKLYVEMVKMDPPEEIDGVSLQDWPQYQADVVRLQKLYEIGGIYLDTDSFLLKPVTDLMDHDCVLSGYVEGFSEGAKRGENEYVSGAVIMARPKSEFIKKWMARLSEGLKTGIWAWHCVVLPIEIYRENKDLLHLIDADMFLPFDFRDKKIIEEDKTEECMEIVKNSYTLHMWDTIWSNELKSINPEYLEKENNAFTRLFGKYAKAAALDYNLKKE